MIVVAEPYGNHGNRFLQNAGIESFCLEYGIPFANLTTGDLAAYYPIGASAWSPLLKLLHLTNASPVVHLDSWDSRDAYAEVFRNRKLVFVDNWCFRIPALLEKHKEYFKRNYSLKPKYYEDNPIFAEIGKSRTAGRAIIGVHIRRRDYREWMDGLYYFGDAVYERCIDRLRSVFRGDEPQFLVFSDEPTSLSGADIIISKNPWYVDIFLLSLCDYTIGPPSTFRVWANYLGDTDTLNICSADMEIRNKDDFKPNVLLG